jgi:hypothetical protein
LLKTFLLKTFLLEEVCSEYVNPCGGLVACWPFHGCQRVKQTESALQHAKWLPQQDLGYNPAPNVHHHMVLI